MEPRAAVGGVLPSSAAGVVREQLQEYARLASALLHALLPSSAAGASATSVGGGGGAGADRQREKSATPEELMERLLRTDQALLRALSQRTPNRSLLANRSLHLSSDFFCSICDDAPSLRAQ